MLLQVSESLFLLALYCQTLETFASASSFFSNTQTIRFVCYLRIALILLGLLSPHPFTWIGLLLTQLFLQQKYGKALNGASDSMILIILLGFILNATLPTPKNWGSIWIATHVMLSYFLAGLVKLKESRWRSGEALYDFIHLKKYATSPSLRSLFQQFPKLALISAWLVILFELSFPLVFLGPEFAKPWLLLGASFHLLNFFSFGLNRFFWIWVSTYPLLYSLSF